MFDDLFTSTTAPTAPAKGGMFSGLFAGTPKAKAPAAPATPPATPWSTPSTTATGDWTRAQPMSIAPKPATPPAPKDNMFKDIWSGVKGAVGGYVSSEKQFLGQQYQGAKQFTQHPVESVHAADAAAYAAADVAAYAAAHAADKQDWAQTEQDSMNDAKAREIAKKIAAKQPITGDEMKIYQESTQRQKEMMDKLTMEAMGAEAGGYRDIEQEAISRAKSILGKAISKYKPPPEMGELEPEATRLEMGAKPTPDIPKPTPKAGTELPPPTGQPASWWAKNTQPLSQIPTPVLEQRLEQKISAQEGNQIRMELERRAKPTTTLKPTEGTGMPKPRGLSVGVEQNAVERKLTQGFGDLPEYKTVNMADQAAKATNLLATDAERAKNIAMGLEQPPSGVLPESVYIAVENKATLAGDTETLRDLATKSSLPEQATTMGQRIRTLGERDDLSPVSKIKEVQTSRTEASAKKLGSKAAKTKVDIVNGIKSEIQKVSSKMTWEDFAKSITCPV